MKKQSIISPANQARQPSPRKLSGMHSRAQFSALEARTLYSADLGVSAALPGVDGSQVASAEVIRSVGPAAYGRDVIVSDKAVADPAAQEAQADKLTSDALFKLVNEVRDPVSEVPLEIVLIDSRVPDTAALRQAFQEEIDTGRNLAVIVVDSQSDGINRVTQMLSLAGQKVSAIHIISHGQDGEFTLGSTNVDSQTLESRSNDFAHWSRYLGADADILIYGCDVARDLTGEQFLTRLGELTGTDVAASKDLTGAKSLGGDWDLEYQSGLINRPTIASSDLQRTWQNILPILTTAEIPVNQTLPGDQMTGGTVFVLDTSGNVTSLIFNGNKNVSVNDAGDTAVTWTNMSNNNVVVRIFRPDGSADTNEIIVYDPVAEGDTNPMRIGETSPSVAMRPDGSFVVTWAAVHQSIADNVYAQRYTSEGLALGPRITVSGASHEYMRSPEIDVDDSGGFVIAYVISDQTGLPANTDPDWKVFVSGFNADGSTRFSHVNIDGSSLVGAKDPSVAVASDGSFVVAYERHWDVTIPLAGTVTSDEIFVSRRNADGTANGFAFQVTTSDTFVPIDPSVDVSRDGSFVVVFNNVDVSTTDYRVVGREYNSAGIALAAQKTISASDGSINIYPSVAVNPNDSSLYVVAWSNAKSLTSAFNVVTDGKPGLQFGPGIKDVTSGNSVQNVTPSVASNGNLISIDYRSSGTPLASSNFDVMMVNHIMDTNAYQDVPPIIQAPISQLMLEDGILNLTLAAGNAIQIGDPDNAGLLSVSLTLPTGLGSFNIANTSMITTLGGASFGGAITANSVSFKGTLTQINSALAQLVYTPPANFNGTVNFGISTTELYGSTPATVSDVAVITVSAVNDAPQLSIASASFQTLPGRSVPLSVSNISAQDLDAGASTVSVEVIALHGTVTITAGGPVTHTAIDRMNGSDRERGVSLTGSLVAINAVLADRLSYASDISFVGLDTIKVTVNDGGNTGAGGPRTASSIISVDVVADPAPVLNGPVNTSGTVYEDSSNALITLFGVPALSISDADAGSSLLRLTLDVSLGQFTSVINSPGILLYGSATPLGSPVAASHIDVTGTVADLNSFLGTLQYVPPPDVSGMSTFTIEVDDQQGHAQSQVSSTRSITIVAVNDAPTASLGGAATTLAEDTWASLTTIFPGAYVNDVDAASGLIQITLNTNNGQIRLGTLGKNLFDTNDIALTADISGATLTFRGTVSNLNAALPSVEFIGAQNTNGGPYSITLSVDDLGNSGGINQTVTTSQFFSITAVDDSPVISFGAMTGPPSEDAPFSIAALFPTISISDIDAGSGNLKLTLSAAQGQLSLGTTGLGLLDATGTSSLSGTLSGTSISFRADLATLNTVIRQVIFTPDANLNGTGFSLSVSVDDLGSTGTVVGAANLASQTRNFSAVAINDRPILSVGATTATVTESTPSALTSIFAGVLSFSDVDAGSSAMKLTVSTTLGSFYLDSTGLSLIDAITLAPLGNPSGVASMVIGGSLSDLNTALQRIQYTPVPNDNTASTITLSIDDLGNTGALVGGLTGTDSVSSLVSISAVDTPPVITLGAAIGPVYEDTPITLGSLYPTMSISDVDAGSGDLLVTLNVTNALLSLDTTSLGLHHATTGAPLSGMHSGASISFKAPLATLNAVLPQVLYTPGHDANGANFMFQLLVDDLGNTGAVTGLGTSDSATSFFNVLAVNDAPVGHIGVQNTDIPEDTPISLASLFVFNELSVSDVDASAAPVALTLSVSSGNLMLDPAGLSLTDTNTGLPVTGALSSGTLNLTGSVAQLNAALQNMLYRSAPNVTTPVMLTLHVDDLGNTGSGVNGVTTETRILSIAGVNDLPVVVLGPPSGPILEDTPTFLGSLFSSVSVSDVDAGGSLMLYTVTGTKGSLSLNTAGLGLLDASSGTALSTTLSGTTISFKANLTAANAALQQVLFVPTLNSNGTGFSVTLSVDDLGNTGAPAATPGPVSVSQSFSVSAVNDLATPNISATSTAVIEDTPTALGSIFASLSVSDPDSGSGNLLVSLTVNKGGLSFDTTGKNLFNATTGAALTGSMSGSTISFQGTKTNLNAVLPSIIFTPAADANGVGYTLSMTVDDKGNTGLAPASTTPLTLVRGFSVSAVNDAPQLSAPNDVNGFEDTPLVFSAANGNQILISDPDGNVSVTIDLSVNHGLLTLGSTSGLIFSRGNASNESQISFTGTVAQLNAALSNLIYTPDRDFAGDASLSLLASDNSNSGSGGAQSVQKTLALRMAQANDLPVIAALGNLAQDAGVATAFSNALLQVTDIESGASEISYTLTATPAMGNMLLNGAVLQAGGNFTQADINAGRISYRSSPVASGTDTIQLSVKDGDGGSTVPIQVQVSVKAQAAFQASSSSSSAANSANTTSTVNSVTNSNVTTAAAGKAADASNAAAAVAGGSAAGTGFTAASGADASGAQKQAGSDAGVSNGLSKAPSANAAGSALSGQGRSDAARLPDASMAPLVPILAVVPPSMPVVSAPDMTKPLEIERPAFITPGITLPSQGLSLDKMVADNGFQKDMEKVREDLLQVSTIDRGVVASTIGVSASFTIGYILWLVRGGVLISSLLASLPAWRMVDPLPVLANLGKAGGSNDDKSLEELVEHSNETDKDAKQLEEEAA